MEILKKYLLFGGYVSMCRDMHIEDITKEGFPAPKKINGKSGKIRTEAKISRNDTCPCNSGKKYKNCCIKK